MEFTHWSFIFNVLCLQIFLLQVPIKLCSRGIYFRCPIHKGDQILHVFFIWYPDQKPVWNLSLLLYFLIRGVYIFLHFPLLCYKYLFSFVIFCVILESGLVSTSCNCLVLNSMHGTQNLVSVSNWINKYVVVQRKSQLSHLRSRH